MCKSQQKTAAVSVETGGEFEANITTNNTCGGFASSVAVGRLKWPWYVFSQLFPFNLWLIKRHYAILDASFLNLIIINSLRVVGLTFVMHSLHLCKSFSKQTVTLCIYLKLDVICSAFFFLLFFLLHSSKPRTLKCVTLQHCSLIKH